MPSAGSSNFTSNAIGIGDDSGGDDSVIIYGPDLNSTRPKMDKKLYRHITLNNGLQCVLICDTVALRRRRAMGADVSGGCYDDDDDDESDDDDDQDSADEYQCDKEVTAASTNAAATAHDDSDSKYSNDDYDEDGIRKAATALLVNVGSYHDPPHLQGLSHFLEHMLFLGTESFPQENAYDAFLSKMGGDDNAYTDMEHTLYHYCIPQDASSGNKNVWKALDMFASFFKCPLLSDNSVERELHAIESEFELNKKDDDNRLSQVRCYTSRGSINGAFVGGDINDNQVNNEEHSHPFSKFPWGNLQSLKVEPESNGIDVMSELRQFYHAHYHAQNMRLVVMAGYDLDEIQRRVVHCFRDVPPSPRILSSDGIAKNDVTAGGISMVTNLNSYGLPFHPNSLGKIYRIVPVQDHHTLSLTFQIPSIIPHWRTKPTEYLAHLIGHEASGSILSVLKERGWATGLSAGTGEDGLGDASTHALFTIEMSLSNVGVTHWEDVINVVFIYIGMLRFNFLEGHVVNSNESGEEMKEEGLPPWIYDELKSIANLSYQFADEGDVTDIVENVAENMAPWANLPKERILDGTELLFADAVDNATVKSLLFNYLTPENIRIDLMSSVFGRDADSDDSNMIYDEEEKKEGSVDDEGVNRPIRASEIRDPANPIEEVLPSFHRDRAGPALLEPRFGTKFWIESISEDVIRRWSRTATPQLPPTQFAIHPPPQNTYIPTKLDLRPPDDAEHPLLNCCLKVCISVGKKKNWFPAAVTKYKIEEAVHCLSLTYEDEDEKWHSLDDHDAYRKFESEDELLEAGHEGSFDCGRVKFRVTAVPREGEGIVFSFGDSGHDDDVEDGVAFPPIPPPAPSSRLPQLIYSRNSINVWHLQDRKFKRPIADLRIKFECAGMNGSALNQACMELFCNLCTDALTETCYLASVCELGSSIYPTDNTGFSIRVHGFDQNLLTLARVVLNAAMSFRRGDGEVGIPSTIKDGRFDACVEVLLRNYSNAGMDASNFTTSLRLLCLRPSIKSSFSKMKALQGITSNEFVQVMSNLLSRLSVDAFYHGNVNRVDADEAARVICESLTSRHVGIPKKKLSSQLVMRAKKSINHHEVIVPTIDHKDPNTAVEVYFQFGIDDNSADAIRQRVLVDLIELILEEPLYNQLRTKEQFGYEVSCGSRWTYGIMGMSFRVVTACKSAVETSDRIDEFLKSFRTDLESMDDQTFMEHLVALAKNKLESFDCLEEETSAHWSEITEGRFDFEINRKEVQCLKTISKDQVVNAYDDWLNPNGKDGRPTERRRLVIHVVGDGPSSMGRPKVDDVGEEIDREVRRFQTSLKNETWGRIRRRGVSSFGNQIIDQENTRC